MGHLLPPWEPQASGSRLARRWATAAHVAEGSLALPMLVLAVLLTLSGSSVGTRAHMHLGSAPPKAPCPSSTGQTCSR